MWSTAASWVALLALTAALTRYYNPELFKKLTRQGLVSPEQKAETVDKVASKRQKTPKRTHATRIESNSGASTPTSANEGLAKKKRKLVTPPVEKTIPSQARSNQTLDVGPEDDSELSNKAFAQQLAKAQAGTKLEPAGAKGTSKKERRAAKKASQGQQDGQDISGLSTEASSATGGQDADDDVSPIGSPSSGPVSTAPTSRADDVSDMLEPSTPKPMTLRLTDATDKVKSLSKSVSKAFEPVLSKKQRQRQAKQAEQKALREESDRLHDAKKQQQLRSARTAAGTSNQIKADSFTAKQNAWQTGAPSAVKATSALPENANAPLLDTFEKEESPAIKVNGAVQAQPLSQISNSVSEHANVNEVRQQKGDNKTSALGASGREKATRPRIESQSSWADEVNEEEQNKWATELVADEKWESVTSKKGKKKVKKDNETSSEASSAITRPTAAVGPATTNGHKTNGLQKGNESVNRYASIQQTNDSSFQDAEWEA